MSEYEGLGLETRPARPGEALRLRRVGPANILAFVAKKEDTDDVVIARVEQGTPMYLSDIPPHLQQKFGVGNTASVIMDRSATSRSFPFCDGVIFEEYGHVSLQDLQEDVFGMVRARTLPASS